jgi:FAD/FMN-containing dehydrogenase
MSTQASRDLRRSFRGPVHRPGDEHYDTQRAAFNPSLDARPLLVAEATCPADVRAAVTWARTHDVPLAVQATGHGTHVASNGALLVKTTRMATVLVDPDRRIAKVGPGARWGDVIAAAAPFGLAPLSGTSPNVGVAGYTFGGGFGLLSRKYGFAADSLVRADLVTADDSLVTASREHDAELFWAVRGGGGNFGVATSLVVRLHPVAEVYAGVSRFPIERAAETLAYFNEFAATEPDELTTAIILDQGSTFTIKTLHVGPAADARRALSPLWNVAGRPVEQDLRTVRYGDISLPAVAPRNFDLHRTLPTAMIDKLVGAVREGSVSAVEVKHWGGAMARPAEDSGPVGHRDVPFSLTINGPADATRPYATGGSFLNFLHDPNAVATAYTPENYRRLREVKRAYDPDNVFRVNLNITPARHEADVLESVAGH